LAYAEVFETGDRIQFTGNGFGKKARERGLKNGYAGTVIGIKEKDGKTEMTVALDTPKAKPVRHWEYSKTDPRYVNPILSSVVQTPQNTITFVVGANGKQGEFNAIKHGYAGTIYRGQGLMRCMLTIPRSGAIRPPTSP
jgi:ATP-dependent exoDNAse (exonuclease V) alpha subunit